MNHGVVCRQTGHPLNKMRKLTKGSKSKTEVTKERTRHSTTTKLILRSSLAEVEELGKGLMGGNEEV